VDDVELEGGVFAGGACDRRFADVELDHSIDTARLAPVLRTKTAGGKFAEHRQPCGVDLVGVGRRVQASQRACAAPANIVVSG
jgi:hypothetical protein